MRRADYCMCSVDLVVVGAVGCLIGGSSSRCNAVVGSAVVGGQLVHLLMCR